MQPDTRNATPEFPEDELLIFIGHSDDASAEALAIKALQTEVQKDFRLLLKTNRDHSPFRRIKLWEWTFDALAIPGGQETVITPALDHAQIAIFIFRERVGKVTWQELEKARERSTTQSLHILAFFPESDLHQGKFPNDQAELQASRDRTTLLERKVELTTFWTNCNGRSVSPLTYQNTEELKAIVLEKLKVSIADILAPDSSGLPFVALKKPDAKSMLRRYHAAIKEELGSIRMLGLPGVESVKVNLNDDTFVPLRLSDRHESGFHTGKQETRQVRDRVEEMLNPDEVMQRAFKKRRMLLVIGDPGSGKTTLIKYYALCALEADHFKRLGFAASVNVFYLPLRDLVRHEKGHYDTLPANFARWSEKHHQPIDATFFDEWLRHGTPLILLDGLDEISNTQDRIEVCQWIDAALHTFTTARFVVTSRATGYRKDEGIELAADYERADVQDFTVAQQERFLKNWFTEAFLKETCPKDVDEMEWARLQRAEAGERTNKMVAHLKAEKNKGLRQLASIPMILQIMAILWKDRDYMPESRVKLYEASLDYLLEFRDKRRGIIPPLSAARARQVLAPISLWMQEKLKKDEALGREMHKKIKEQLDKQDKPPSIEDFCDYLVKRAGLLVETGAHDYLFRHKSFREYLAGVQLVTKVRSTKYIGNLITGFGQDWWDEPIRFFMAQGDEEIFNLFMKKLFDSPVSEQLSQKQQLLLQTIIEESPLKKVDALCKKLLDPATTASRQRVILDCLKAIGKPAALEALQKFILEGFAKNS
ncbi:MAG: NACHT domain-containing protein, partial [Chlorobium sp.]